MGKTDQGQDMQQRRDQRERIAMSLEEREAELQAAMSDEPASQRDAKDQRSDLITARLLDMVVSLQREFMAHLRKETMVVQELKEGLARVEKRVEEFISAFPEGDAVKHRLAHEEQMSEAHKTREFWERIKFTLVALALTAGAGWLGVIVWKAFLLGPK